MIPVRSIDSSRPARREQLVGLCFLFTGAGLVGHIVFDAPLSLTTALTFAGAIAFFVALYRSGMVRGHDVAQRVRVGLLAGLLATIAYDVTRGLTWRLWLSGVWPFEAFRHFGRGLIGAGASDSAALVAGTAFHTTNGLLFALAFVTLLGRRPLWWAIVWGLVLETFTLLLYPDWLGITRFAEFAEISALGHLAYGSVLGLVSRRLLPGAPHGHEADRAAGEAAGEAADR